MARFLTNWKFWLGIIVTIVFLWWAFHGMDFGGIKRSILEADYLPLIPAGALVMVGMAFRALRWRVIFRPIKKISFGTLFTYQMIGFMTLNVLPMRVGELIKAYLLGRKERIPMSLVLATVIVERVFDILSVVLLLLGSLLLLDLEGGEGTEFIRSLYGKAYFALGLIGGLVLFLGFLRLQTRRCLKLVERILFFLPERFRIKILGLLEEFAEGLSCIRDLGGLLQIVFYSGGLWLLMAGSFYVSMYSFGWNGATLAEAVGIKGALFVQGVVALMVAAPSSPGFVGPFQLGIVMAFEVFKVSGSAVGGYSILVHAMNYILITSIGFIYFWKEGLSFSGLVEASEREGHKAQAIEESRARKEIQEG